MLGIIQYLWRQEQSVAVPFIEEPFWRGGGQNLGGQIAYDWLICSGSELFCYVPVVKLFGERCF